MNKIKLYSAITVSAVALLAGGIIGAKNPNFGFSSFIARAEDSYSCNSFVFGDVVSTNFDTRTSTFVYDASQSTFVLNTDITISYVQGVNHVKSATGPIKVGGSSKNGELNLTLLNLECSRVIIYAATSTEQASGELTVNSVKLPIHTTADGNYDFTIPYIFNIDRTQTINIKNTLHKGEVYISKIVFRTH